MHDAGGVALLRQLLPLFSSRLIRNRATLGGNLATASPIGDSPPVLLALDAEVTLARAGGSRRIRLRDFFLSYRKTALAPGEIIEAVHIPLPLREHHRFYKVSKRVLDDISTVAAGYRLRIRQDRIEDVRIAFGGMAATPKRARAVEAALKKDGFAAAAAALETEFKPIDDWRGTAAYRLQAAKNLLRRLELRLTSPGYAVEVEAL